MFMYIYEERDKIMIFVCIVIKKTLYGLFCEYEKLC